jgi:hypothetical protein
VVIHGEGASFSLISMPPWKRYLVNFATLQLRESERSRQLVRHPRTAAEWLFQRSAQGANSSMTIFTWESARSRERRSSRFCEFPARPIGDSHA